MIRHELQPVRERLFRRLTRSIGLEQIIFFFFLHVYTGKRERKFELMVSVSLNMIYN
jgi:hypothetical protein